MTQATSLWNSYFQEISGQKLDSQTKTPITRIVAQKQLMSARDAISTSSTLITANL